MENNGKELKEFCYIIDRQIKLLKDFTSYYKKVRISQKLMKNLKHNISIIIAFINQMKLKLE